MARKAVAIPTRAVATPDDWVSQKPQFDRSSEPMIRLSVDLPESVHTRLKLKCVANRQKLAEWVRKLIERDLQEAA